MARVQQVQPANKKTPVKSTPTNQQPKSKQELSKTSAKHEPTKNEIMFFRIGMSIIALTLITVAIIFTIQYFMNKEEEEGLFDDYIHLTASELTQLTGYDSNSGVYGDFTYFAGQEAYEDLYALINTNTKIYIYFYSASSPNDEIVNLIKDTDWEGKALFLVNLDLQKNNLGGAALSHLNLDLNRSNLLVTFDVENQTFSTDIRVTDIVRVLGRI
jgi:hypothetical protein